MSQAVASTSFAYRAQTPNGQSVSGTIDAASIADAGQRLDAMGLRLIELESASRPQRARPLRGEDFLAFNEQLAQLAGAGLPVEQGLRLMAASMGRGAMPATLRAVTNDLESGLSLPEAIDKHRKQFPPLYARLVDAGIRAGNLSAILLNLGRHLTLVQRLRATLWRALSYPLIVMILFVGILIFVATELGPQMRAMYVRSHIALPAASRVALDALAIVGFWPLWATVGIGLAIVVALLLWSRRTPRSRLIGERFLLALPMVGIAFKRSLLARWCDAAALAVQAGLDIPGAIALADDAVASPALSADGAAMVSALSAGRAIHDAPPGRIVPPTVVAAIELASARGDLPAALTSLAQMYQQQAERQLSSIATIVPTIALIGLGVVIGFLALAMFAPMLQLLFMF
jgi:type II secretory pathway component PulF